MGPGWVVFVPILFLRRRLRLSISGFGGYQPNGHAGAVARQPRMVLAPFIGVPMWLRVKGVAEYLTALVGRGAGLSTVRQAVSARGGRPPRRGTGLVH